MRVAAGIVALLVVLAIAALAPLAYADPPDPFWIDGYWDDDDFDNVVVMVFHSLGIVELPRLDAGPLEVAVAFVEPPTIHATPAPVDATSSPRAPPPTSWSV